EPPTIRAESHAQTWSGDARMNDAESLLLLGQALLVEPLGVPELHLPVAARRGEVLATLAKDQSASFPYVGAEQADPRMGLCIPNLHSDIDFSCDQVAAVGAERHGVVWQSESSRNGQKLECLLSSHRVPNPHCIDTRRGDKRVFGVPGDTEDNN